MTPDFTRRLARFAACDHRPGGGIRPATPGLWAFLCHTRERLAAVRVERTILIVVIEGTKELAADGDAPGAVHRFPAGSAILLPAGWSGAVVNEPDPAGGAYRALVLEFPAELVRRVLRAHAGPSSAGAGAPPPAARPVRPGFGVPVTPALAEAVLHAAAALVADSAVGPRIVDHRCMEVLLALLDAGVWWLGPGCPAAGVTDAVRERVRSQPGRAWTAADLAAELGLGLATFRRRLAAEGTSLRALLRDERMAVARYLLETEGLAVQEAASAVGYSSRAHFARRVRSATGVAPSQLKG